ncbi:MAG TPA: A24 family peptidase [Aliidiomarina sp.]|nr:A24 family peptidase [Aliidiomarina sp.]
MLDLIQSSFIWSVGFAAIIGLLFGSFANVVIARFPVILQRQWQTDCAESLGQTPPTFERFNLAVPGSQCPSCKTSLHWYENIPVLSFLIQQAKCRHCRVAISFRYPLVEVLTALLTAVTIAIFGFTPLGWSYALFIYALLILTFIDKDHMLLPDQLTLPLIWLGLLASLQLTPLSPADSIIGAVTGYLALWSVFWLFKLITGKEGMGYGDFKLLAALGAWLGWQMLPMIILLSSVIGALFGILMLLLRRHQQGNPMPFGPFLALAGIVALFFGETLYNTYWQWVGV